MRTLAQVRAANALLWKDRIGGGQRGGDAVSGFPTMVATNGLLAALAFAVEAKECKRPQDEKPQHLVERVVDGRKVSLVRKHKGEFDIASASAYHLACEEIDITKANNADALVAELAKAADASQLRRATAEALAYLNYLKRFVA